MLGRTDEPDIGMICPQKRTSWPPAQQPQRYEDGGGAVSGMQLLV